MGASLDAADAFFDLQGKTGYDGHSLDGLQGLTCLQTGFIGNRGHFNIDIFDDESGTPDFQADDHVVDDTGRYDLTGGTIGIDQTVIFKLSFHDDGVITADIGRNGDVPCVYGLKFFFVNAYHGFFHRSFLGCRFASY